MPKEEIAEINLNDLNNEETEETENEEVEETEESEDEPQGETDDDSEEEAQEEEASEEAQPEEELTDDFREWASQYGELPESIKTEEDLLKAYQAILPEMKRAQSGDQRLREVDNALRAAGYANGVSDILDKRTPAASPPERGERYFPKDAARSFVETMVKDGQLDNESQQSYKAIAQFVDRVYGPQFEKVEEVFTAAMKGMVDNRKVLRDIMWKQLPDGVQKSVDRREVETILDRGLFATPEEAIRYVAFNKPDVIDSLTQNAEQRGQEKARKKLRRRYAISRSKTPAKKQPTYDYEKFKRPDGQWDEDKITKQLGYDKGLKMIEAWEAENK